MTLVVLLESRQEKVQEPNNKKGMLILIANLNEENNKETFITCADSHTMHDLRNLHSNVKKNTNYTVLSSAQFKEVKVATASDTYVKVLETLPIPTFLSNFHHQHAFIITEITTTKCTAKCVTMLNTPLVACIIYNFIFCKPIKVMGKKVTTSTSSVQEKVIYCISKCQH